MLILNYFKGEWWSSKRISFKHFTDLFEQQDLRIVQFWSKIGKERLKFVRNNDRALEGKLTVELYAIRFWAGGSVFHQGVNTLERHAYVYFIYALNCNFHSIQSLVEVFTINLFKYQQADYHKFCANIETAFLAVS